ncbi:MAG: nitroreductase [Candidatus Harrisonbacteria bacterium CG10_big_fil_rev_8_21_14_0_10_42_17]|uniref:Nitroreductase n=1 Tax=Candidatus Harrisonbacteria bacterium CG10_big_fil_rev_8_21_14_0_10_42_17 TaxID=1974584 RepID=A0A2M6WIK6_9BACT|nr:MAG: nitroreductase [Candidatus Harrisonbacteria bacterium CG10_big_fil_rev_8_21_14_0_10_42_17]
MKDYLKNILEIAIHAPSGENCQPWRFKIEEDKVFIYNNPKSDESLYNFKQRGSLIAHGMLLENIAIASSVHGYQINIALFPHGDHLQNLVAVVEFQKTVVEHQSLYDSILKRVTNRKRYQRTALALEQRDSILRVGSGTGWGKIYLTEEHRHINTLARVGSMNERLVFENSSLHNFLFSHITWTKAEDNNKRVGFYIKTLEMPMPAKVFRVFQSWSLVKALNRVGFSKTIWKQNAKTYSSSSAMGIIGFRGNSSKDFVLAGRLFQRLWLTTTKEGLSLQPLTGVLFFMQRILEGDYDHFSSHHVELIKSSYDHVVKIFGLSEDVAVPIMFRIGYGGHPSARASRFSLNELLIQDHSL